MIVRFSTWFLLFLIGLIQPLVAQKFFVKNYSTSDGLPQNQVYSILQDDLGFIWFGTAGGLSRYNGRTFTNYTKEQGLISNVIRDIYQSSDMNLWLATDEGISCYYTREDSFVNYNYSDGVGKGIVKSIIEDREGNLWFATASGLSYRSHTTRTFRTITAQDGLPSNVTYCLSKDSSGRIIVGTLEGVAFVQLLPDDKLEISTLSIRHGLIHNRIEALCFDSHQQLWVGTPLGLSRVEKNRISNYRAADGLAYNSVRSVIEDSRGYIWIATERGISRASVQDDRIVFKNYTERHGLGSDQFYTVMEDRENNFWFGTFSNGASKLISDELVSFTQSEGLAGEAIIALAENRNGEILAGTTNGLSVLKDYVLRSYTSSDGLGATNIWDIEVDSLGIVWLGTYTGLKAFIPKNYLAQYPNLSSTRQTAALNLISRSESIQDFFSVNLSNHPALAGNWIPDIFVDSRERIWFVSMDKGVGYIQLKTGGNLDVKLFTTHDGLINNNGWCVYEDTKGRIWVGMIGGGLALFNEATQRFHCYTRSDGLADDLALSLCEDNSGNLWIGGERGVSILKIDKIPLLATNFNIRDLVRYFSKKDGLSDNTVNAIERDPDGTLWIGTNNGLNHMDPVTGKVMNVYTKKRGLIDNEISTHNSLIVTNNMIWIGTSSGITRMSTHSTQLKSFPPPAVYLTQMIAEDKSQKQTEILSRRALDPFLAPNDSTFFSHLFFPTQQEIAYEQNNVTFEFVGLSFKDEADVVYRYRLIGFDNEWSAPSRENKIRYTNLNNGRYVFEVMAQNGFGMWNEKPLSVHFTIRTPFWKSWWFVMFILTFIGFSIYTVYRFRISLVHERTAELEQKVIYRTKELIKEKENVERILIELKETQMHLIHSEKMASLGQLVAGVAHEINNPIAYVKANVSLLERKVDDVQRMFHAFTDIFDFYESFKHNGDSKHAQLAQKLEDIDRMIGETKFEKFLAELPDIVSEMRDGVERTQKIVEDLRNFSRLDESNYKEVSVNDSIESTLNILKNEYKTRVNIHREYGNLPPIYCNPGHINQVLLNLLTNAFQAIQNQGDVWIKTLSGTNNILITIRDNGVGIPKEIQSKVFDPFFTTKPVGRGTGLGLSISLKIIENHKGTIFFESTPGKGTEFKITLPLRKTVSA